MAEEDEVEESEEVRPAVGEDSSLSALEYNIALKGHNAYYYAHNSKERGPEWDGDPCPRLLERQVSEPTKERSFITRFSWLDDEKKIRVYVPFDADEPVTPEAIDLQWTETSLKMTWDLPRCVRVLSVPKLYDTITGAAVKVKADKVVLSLTKPPNTTFKWYDIKK